MGKLSILGIGNLARAFALLLSIALALFAQSQIKGSLDDRTLITFLVAGLIGFVGSVPLTTKPIPKGESETTSRKQDRYRTRRLVLFAAAICVALLAVAIFHANQNNGLAWLLHLASIGLFLGAFVVVKWPPREVMGLRPNSVLRWFPFLVVIGVALWLRFLDLDVYPFGMWFDNATTSIEAKRILSDSTYRPVWSDPFAGPAHPVYLLAAAMAIFGPIDYAGRVVTALIGAGCVVFAYLLFRRWLGEIPALLAAGFCAVMAFNLNYSRALYINGVIVPFWVLLNLFLIDRALETRSSGRFACVGIGLGLTIAFYTPLRVFLAVALLGIVIFAVVHSIQVRKQTSFIESARKWSVHLLLILCGIVIAALPILHFAVTQPSKYAGRLNEASILTKRDEPDLIVALTKSTQKHLQMFNVVGDRNGRHNLPGAPMLDPYMGALSVVGIFLALRRFWLLPNALMITLFAGLLLPGILSLDFEAPQSLRASGTQAPLLYFSVLPLAQLIETGLRSFRPQTSASNGVLSRPAVFWPLAAVAAVAIWIVGSHNYERFFVRQRANWQVWTDHSAPESIIAAEMKGLAATHDLIVGTGYPGHPVVRFLTNEMRARQEWNGVDDLRVDPNNSKGYAILLDARSEASVNQIRSAYPGAEISLLTAPGGSDGLIYEILIETDDLRSVHGSELVRPGMPPIPLQTTSLQGNANAIAEASSLAAAGTPVELRGMLNAAQAGNYVFAAAGGSKMRLFVNEREIELGRPLALPRGTHLYRLQLDSKRLDDALLVQAPNMTSPATPQLSMLLRGTTRGGLEAKYYRGSGASGSPAIWQIDPQINFYFHILPLPRPYSVVWEGAIFAPVTGTYKFASDTIDDSQTYINGQLVIENRGGGIVENSLSLASGWHTLRMNFNDTTGYTRAYLYWTPPGGARSIVPSANLSPPMGIYPPSAQLASAASIAPITRLPYQPRYSARSVPISR